MSSIKGESRPDIQEQVLNETLSGLSKEDGPDTAESCCVICLCAVTEACSATPCSHRNFDFLCLASWLQLKPSCPLCKAEVVEIAYDFTNEGRTWKTYKVPKIGLEPAAPRPGPERQTTRTSPPGHSGFTRGREPRRGAHRGGIPRTTRVSAGLSSPDSRAREGLARRRHVYRNRLYSLHVGSNPASRYREIGPSHFESDPELLSRARAWIRRELQVFEFLSDDGVSAAPDGGGGSGGGNAAEGRRRRQNNASFVLEYIVAILKTVDLQASSGHAENLLSDFVGRDHCKIFLHELRSFLRSPYSIEAWDRHVQYDESPTSPRPRQEINAEGGRGGAARDFGLRGDRYRPRTRSRPPERTLRDVSNRHLHRGGVRRKESWRPG